MNYWIHSQNLTPNNRGWLFSHGRAWIHRRTGHRDLFHCEWMFGKYARGFGATITLGYGDGEDGLMLHLCLPWIFSVYLCFENIFSCAEREFGVAIHNCALWIYLFNKCNESHSTDKWWQRSHAFYFPWNWEWHSTEVLSQDLSTCVWREDRSHRHQFLGRYDQQKAAEKSVSRSAPYVYVRKSGERQEATATFHVERREWRARWWPLVPRKKIRTDISVNFDRELGEGAGSWKGGVLGTGCGMKPGETPLQTLERMQREVIFSR